MSLAIVILMDTGAVVFTDSRSTASDFSKSETGVKKLAVLTLKEGKAVVAFTGDGEINGKLTLDLLSELAAGVEKPDVLPEALSEGVSTAFQTDVANFAWESDGDKEAYLRDAKVALHVLTAPKTHSIRVVTPTHIERISFPEGANEAFSGVRMIKCFTGNYTKWDLNLVRAHLPQSIDDLCKHERTCGYPVDVTVWQINSDPQVTRCADLDAINAYLASLKM
jgi:hypothetical protein